MLVSVVRHAESLGNAGMLTEDDPDPLLSPKGEMQAALTARRLAAEGVTHIWSSPFRRAVQTASYLAEQLGAEVLLAPEMVEHYIFEDLEHYAGRSGAQLAAEFSCVRVPEGFPDGRWTPGYPESWEMCLERLAGLAGRILDFGTRAGKVAASSSPLPVEGVADAPKSRLVGTTREGKGEGDDDVHLAVFGHGASVKALMIALGGEAIERDAGFTNCCVSRVRLDGALPGELLFLNNTSHLQDM